MKTFQTIEKEYFNNGTQILAGTDEVGRGPLAGPVVAAAVVFHRDTVIEGVDDSKKLSAERREELAEIIKAKCISYGIGIVNNDEIDEMNILNASLVAMTKAVNELIIKPDLILVDGKFGLYPPLKSKAIIKGDSKCFSIAAASIIAKVYRDKLMDIFGELYPNFNLQKNKGYGTKEHIDSIERFGITPIHRISFLQKIYARKYEQTAFQF